MSERTPTTEIEALASRIHHCERPDCNCADEIMEAIAAARADAERERDEARDRLTFTERWFGVRWERLHAWAKEHGRDEVFSIMANGTASHLDPPTYAQQLNRETHRANAAEERERGLRETLEEVPAALDRARQQAIDLCARIVENANPSDPRARIAARIRDLPTSAAPAPSRPDADRALVDEWSKLPCVYVTPRCPKRLGDANPDRMWCQSCRARRAVSARPGPPAVESAPVPAPGAEAMARLAELGRAEIEFRVADHLACEAQRRASEIGFHGEGYESPGYLRARAESEEARAKVEPARTRWAALRDPLLRSALPAAPPASPEEG